MYSVGDTLTLTCVIDPLLTSTSSIVSYLWLCSGCFADRLTSPMISRTLTDIDNVMIECNATVDGVEFISMPFYVQVTGTYVYVNIPL